MRKTLAVAAMTVALTTGTTAGVAFADDTVASPQAQTQESTTNQESDKTGLWGLLGLLGLAGLAKRKENNDVDAQARR